MLDIQIRCLLLFIGPTSQHERRKRRRCSTKRRKSPLVHPNNFFSDIYCSTKIGDDSYGDDSLQFTNAETAEECAKSCKDHASCEVYSFTTDDWYQAWNRNACYFKWTNAGLIEKQLSGIVSGQCKFQTLLQFAIIQDSTNLLCYSLVSNKRGSTSIYLRKSPIFSVILEVCSFLVSKSVKTNNSKHF